MDFAWIEATSPEQAKKNIYNLSLYNEFFMFNSHQEIYLPRMKNKEKIFLSS